MTRRKILCVGGARPNFMKLAPLTRALAAAGFDVVLVHTGQHYDDRMSESFFRDLGIPQPAHRLEVGSDSHARQTARILERMEPVLTGEAPAALVVVGDVNSTAASALAAAKLGIPVVHVEAGLRSFDRSMPEEINRLVTDAISDLFLITEEGGRENLLREGVPEPRLAVVGNLMVDTLLENLERARRLPSPFDPPPEAPYGVVTLHRPSNVNDPALLDGILSALEIVARHQPLWFPVHPRTAARLAELRPRGIPSVRVAEPLGYLDFLALMSGAAVVLTDSGGIQEETTALGIPCLTLRENTERPVTVTQGSNRLAGATRESILEAWEAHLRAPKTGRVPPLWDGRAASRCVDAIREFLAAAPGRERSGTVRQLP